MNVGPWNYSIILTFRPLYGAIAAGCPTLIKPSEVVPTKFSKLLSELVPKYLDPRRLHRTRRHTRDNQDPQAQMASTGAPIFYTGNARVMYIISAAAAKPLTPMTLELVYVSFRCVSLRFGVPFEAFFVLRFCRL
ncbi:hypothetical protein DFP72DRAFT_1122961 [Ephemerocybe angulata]|uniref:Aldehyde dehydrogenase domain-containing protein n=1 Tax=Ephemerocybe angulata TaxID=980116 RepID=A0A8H6M7S7_9AGAR|nr:hypothetical protein DFP72DRAFT_1122961 [Tulosesus angulatus]